VSAVQWATGTTKAMKAELQYINQLLQSVF
jgi:hypothetical protein